MPDNIAAGQATYQKLLDAGFSQQEAEQWKQERSQTLSKAGFSPEEIDSYWGEQKPDLSQLDAHIQTNMAKAPSQEYSDNPLNAIAAGFDMSSLGVASKVLRGKNPHDLPPEYSGWGADVLKMGGQLAGDAIPSILGAVGAGALASETGPGAFVAAGAGGMALPTAIRETFMDAYDNGTPVDARQVLTRAAHITWETAKSAAAGAIGGKLGGKVLEVASPVLPKVGAALASDISFGIGATTVSSAFAGQVPTVKELALSSAAVVGFHVAGKAIPKVAYKQAEAGLKDNYVRTGVHPTDAARAAAGDPQVQQEIFAPRDVDGYPQTPAHDAMSPGEPDPFVKPDRSPDLTGLKNGGFGVHDEHHAMMDQLKADALKAVDKKSGVTAELNPEATIKAAHLDHLSLIEELEGSAAAAKKQGVSVDEVVSKAGAIGKYQIMPATAKAFGFDPTKLTDPAVNRAVAEKLTAQLAHQYPGDTEAQLIAYNAGPRAANKFIASGRDPKSIPVETQHYLEHAQRLGADIKTDFIGRHLTRMLVEQGVNTRGLPPAGGGRGGMGGNGGPPLDGEVLPPEPGAKKIETDRMTLSPEQARLKLLDNVVNPEGVSKVADLASTLNPLNIVSAFVSELSPLRKLDSKLGSDRSKMTLEDHMRTNYGTGDRALFTLTEGTVDPITRTRTSDANDLDAYRAAIEDGGSIPEFTGYRLARRAKEKMDQGIDLKLDPKLVERALSAEGHEKYARALEIKQKANDGAVDYLVKSGRYSPEQGKAMKELNREYITMQRLQDDGYRPPSAGKFFRAKNVVRKMVGGSERPIIDPITAEMSNRFAQIAEADRNISVRAVTDAILKAQEKLEHPILEHRFDIDTSGEKVHIGQILDDQGQPLSPLAEEAAKDMIIERNWRGAMGPNDYVVYRNGKPEVYTAHDPQIAKLLSNPRVMNIPAIVKFAQIFGRMQRLGLVATPEFTPRVLLHATLESSAFGEKMTVPGRDALGGLKNIGELGLVKLGQNVHFLKAMGASMEAAGLGKYWEEFRLNGGMNTALSDIDRNYVSEAARKMRDATGVDKAIINRASHPVEMVRMARHYVDATPRLGSYARLRKQGVAPEKAAMLARTGMIDFGEPLSHPIATETAKAIPFFLAGVKDIEQVARAFELRPFSTALTGFAYLTIPTLVLYGINYQADQGKAPNDPTRMDQIARHVRDTHFLLHLDGGEPLQLTKPYVGGFLFSTLVERMLDDVVRKDPHALDGFFEAFLEQSLPPHQFPLTTPMIEQWSNKKFYGDMPLIPESLAHRHGYMQYTPNTTETAKAIARELGPAGLGVANVSPIVLEEYARQWSGQLPLRVINTIERTSGVKPPTRPDSLADNPFYGSFFHRRTEMNANSIEDFYTDYNDVMTANGSMKAAISNRDVLEIATSREDALTGLKLNNYKKAIDNSRKVIQTISENPKLTVDEKRQYVDKLVERAIQMAQAGSHIVEVMKERKNGE